MAKYIITPDGGVQRSPCGCNCAQVNRTIKNDAYLSLAADVIELAWLHEQADTPVREALQSVADRIKRTVEND